MTEQAEPEIRYLSDVQRLRLEPGDVVVLTTEWKLSAVEVQRIAEKIGKVLPGHQVLVIDSGVKIGVMGPDGGTE